MQQNRCSEQTAAADTEKLSSFACTSTATAVPLPLSLILNDGTDTYVAI